MWDLTLDEQEEAIVAALRQWLARELPLARLRPGQTPTEPRAALHALAELGWLGIGLPEASGAADGQQRVAQRSRGPGLMAPVVTMGDRGWAEEVIAFTVVADLK